MRRSHLAPLVGLLCALVFLAGCVRSHLQERKLEELAEEYTRALVERRLDDARRLLTGDALQAAELAFPLMQAVDVKQKLLEVDAAADPVDRGDTRAAVRVSYRVETDVPGFGTVTERVTGLYDLAVAGGEWRIFRVSILGSDKEGAS